MALSRFAETEDRDKRLEPLVPHIRRVADSHLRSKCPDKDRRNDIVQDVLIRFAIKVEEFEVRTEGEFKSYVRQIAQREWYSAHRKRDFASPTDAEHLEVVPDELCLDEGVLSAEQQQTLKNLADKVLLGIEPSAIARELLAVQMFLAGAEFEEIAAVLGCNPHRTTFTSEELVQWSKDALVLRHVARNALYVGSARLTQTILGKGNPIRQDPSEVMDTSRRRNGPSGIEDWSWLEVEAILWRYLYAVPLSRIVMMELCRLERDRLEGLFMECERHFPFVGICRKLGSESGLNDSLRSCLNEKHVWQRLAFEYWYFDELPQDDIVSRLKSPANDCGYGLTDAAIKNAWLGNHRLLGAVVKVAQQVQCS